jgi:predicted negative regulator of RcsB-dependent stress response
MVLCDLERFDEAAEQAARSQELTAEDDFASLAAWRMAQARVASHRGSHHQAIALAEEAIAIMEPTDYLAWQGEGHEVHAMALASAGRKDEARIAFGRALEHFQRKGVIPATERVRRRLSSM